MSNAIISQFLEKRKHLTILDGKKPLINNWPSEVLNQKALLNHEGNYGWVLGKNDLVIDIDPRNGGNEGYQELCHDLGYELVKTVKTAGNGWHIYFKYDSDSVGKLRKPRGKYKGIDILTRGKQCVIPGSEVNGKFYIWDKDNTHNEFIQQQAPSELIKLLDSSLTIIKNTDAEDGNAFQELEQLVNSSGFSQAEPEQVKKWLWEIDSDVEYDTWYRVGMALYSWDKDKGLELFDKWSSQGSKYKEGECEAKWATFSDQGISLGTLVHLSRDASYGKSIDEAVEIIRSSSNKKDLELEVVPKVKEMNLKGVDFNTAANALKIRMKELTGFAPPISMMRSLIMPTFEFGHENHTPEWCKPWLFDSSQDRYVNMETGLMVSSPAFNAICGKYVPESEGGGKPSASKFVADHGYVRIVGACRYNPLSKDAIYIEEQTEYYNLFNHNKTPKANEEYVNDITPILDHFRNILGEKDSEIMFDWLAWQVQHPGQLLLWAPVIQGKYGIGKTFIERLLNAALGDHNVDSVGPVAVCSNFNSWAEGKLVTVLNELKVAGHNRYETLNNLKPLITDRKVSINDKGIRPYTIRNHTNYLATTNFKDAIPIDEEDRRWWIVFAKAPEIKDKTAYFDRIFDLLEEPGDIRKWLEDHEISEGFRNLRGAPDSWAKRTVIHTENANHQGYNEAKMLLEQGGHGYCKEAFDSHSLATAIENELDMIINKLAVNHINGIYKRLGYTQHPKVVKWEGKSRRIWTVKPMTNAEIREVLSKD